MKSKEVIIDKRNKLQKEMTDLLELRKEVFNIIGEQDTNNFFEEAIESITKQLKLIDWILN